MSCAVNGLNGDYSTQTCGGRQYRQQCHLRGRQHCRLSLKVTNVDLLVEQGRVVEDLLRPFLAGETPVTGPVVLHGHANLAGAGASFFERLTMNGAFTVPGGLLYWTPHTERNLTAFSQRAQGTKTGEIPPLCSQVSPQPYPLAMKWRIYPR